MAADDLRKGAHYFFTKYRVIAGALLAALSAGMGIGASVVYWILTATE